MITRAELEFQSSRPLPLEQHLRLRVPVNLALQDHLAPLVAPAQGLQLGREPGRVVSPGTAPDQHVGVQPPVPGRAAGQDGVGPGVRGGGVELVQGVELLVGSG